MACMGSCSNCSTKGRQLDGVGKLAALFIYHMGMRFPNKLRIEKKWGKLFLLSFLVIIYKAYINLNILFMNKQFNKLEVKILINMLIYIVNLTILKVLMIPYQVLILVYMLS